MATLVTGNMVTDRTIETADIANNAVGVAQLSAGAIAQSFGDTSGAFNFRNKIINGSFDIWQRGTSFAGIANGAYSADRWEIAYNGSGGTRTISRQTFDLGQTDVPYEPTYYLEWNQSVAGTGATFNYLRQKIESVRILANKQITVSFYAKAATTLTAAIFGLQYFGSGGSANTLTTGSGTINVTTSWQKFTVNLTVPSLATKSIGSSNDDCLILTLALPLNTTFTFDIAQVQVEEGTVATPFEQRPIGMELQLCQRYYQVLEEIIVSGYGPTGGLVWASGTWLAPLRVDPGSSGMTVTSTGVSNTFGGAYNNSSKTTWTVQNQIVNVGIGWGFVSIVANAEL